MVDPKSKAVTSKASVFAVLDDAPMTPAHYGYWLLASGGTLLDGFSVVSLGIALPLLTRDFKISPAMVGLIGSALVLGAVLGAAVGGVAATGLAGSAFSWRICLSSPEARCFVLLHRNPCRS